MMIKSIEFKDHEILGDLFLRFHDDQGEPYKTILLAGENGCGKSTVLEAIFDFSRFTVIQRNITGKVIFTVICTDYEVGLMSLDPATTHYLSNGLENNQMEITLDYSLSSRGWEYIKVRFFDNSGTEWNMNGSSFNTSLMASVTKSVYSDVEVNFTPQNIQYVTAKDIDQTIGNSIKSQGGLATEISQLLVDVQAIDDAEFAEWGRNNIGHSVDETVIDSRMKRFKDAFDFMFPSKRYKKVKNDNGAKKVIFEEFGREMSIEELSSGEKQIVFRGGFLLKDKKSTQGALVIIDEPEVSLHPNWQLRILEFFKKLFTDENGNQTSQLIIATHSPFILHNESRNMDKVIILKKNEAGRVYTADVAEFYGWTPEQAIKEAFNIDLDFGQDKTFVYVEGETDEKYIKKAAEVLDKNYSDIEFTWIGRVNEKGGREFTGDKALNQAKAFILANPMSMQQQTILLYDSDTRKPDEQFEQHRLFVRCMPVNLDNTLYKKGIENLLELPENFPKKEFYRECVETNDYGAESIIRDLDKNKLCEYVCDKLPVDEQKMIFQKFELLFAVIETAFNDH